MYCQHIDLARNDIAALENLLFSVHLQDLLDVTHTVHYANYFFQRLSSIAEASRFLFSADSREPLIPMEAEPVKRQKKLAQSEDDMEAVFEQKFLERTKKQQEMELELTESMIQLDDQLITQLPT
ncbi:Septin-7 [Fasciola hepatica]|uniref:Septin-7 n=1 Tax=Fasciola hepatica TaxID=6192 RepID=A0A4E0QXP4_FASHE|nr:Septin-7 [Fasciola hepatica]